MRYGVTRQLRQDGVQLVEIALGGLEYSGPDVLTRRYEGELADYDSCVEAVKAAMRIVEAWERESSRPVFIGAGFTCCGSLPVEAKEPAEVYDALLEWAAQQDAAGPRCDRCGKRLGEEWYYVPALSGLRFCSEYCADVYGAGE